MPKPTFFLLHLRSPIWVLLSDLGRTLFFLFFTFKAKNDQKLAQIMFLIRQRKIWPSFLSSKNRLRSRKRGSLARGAQLNFSRPVLSNNRAPMPVGARENLRKSYPQLPPEHRHRYVNRGFVDDWWSYT